MKKFTLKSVLGTFFISYIIVLILPLLISQLLYWTSCSIIKNNIQNLNRIALSQTAASIDQMFLDIRSTGREILASEEVDSITYAKLPLNSIKRQKIGSFHKKLKERIAYSQYLESIHVYFNSIDYVASTEGFLPKDFFLTELKSNYDIDSDSFFEWIDSHDDYQVKMLTRQDRSSEHVSKIMVIMTTMPYGGRPDVSIIFTVNIQTIKNLLSNYHNGSSEENPYVWILSEDNELMIHQDCSSEHAELISSIIHWGKETDEIQSLHKNFAVTKIHSDVTGWSLISAISIKHYASQLRNIQMYYVIFIILCVSIGLAASIFFSYKNYSPIKRLTELVGGNPTELTELNEFSFVEESLITLLNNKTGYMKEIDKQKSELKQLNLVRMLQGSIYSNQAFNTICADYDIIFSTNQFLLIGILIRDYSNVFFEETTTDDEETTELMYFIVTSITEELVREEYDAYICRDEGNLYCIASLKELATDDDMKLHKKKLIQICQRCEAFIRKKFGIILSFYVSEPYADKHSNIKSISRGYKEVQWAFEQIEGFNISNPVVDKKCLMKDIATIENNGDPIPVRAKRNQLYNAVSSGNIDEAIKLCRDLLNEGISLANKSFSIIRINSIILLDFCLSHIEPKLVQTSDRELSRLINDINNARNIEALIKTMRKAFEYIYQIQEQEMQNESSVDLFADISHYIENNITDPDLSVASVADRFEISQSYLLKIFKDRSGSGVLDYIHQCRIDMAKQLLKNTSKTVKDIAEEVGYTNALTFMRAFKRLEGITPTNYRNMTS